MLDTQPHFKLTYLQANLISLGLVGTVMAVLLALSIGYRDTSMGIMALGGLVASGVALAIFVRPELGSYILLVSIYTNMSSILGDRGWPSINKPLIALVFLSLVGHHLYHRSFLAFKRTEWFILAYGGVWLVSYFVAQDTGEVITRVLAFGKDFIMILCVVYSLESRPGSWKLAVWLLILSAGLLTVFGAYQVLTGNVHQTFYGFSQFMEAQIVENFDDGRLIGPLADPNYYGQMLVAVLPLVLYRILDERKTIVKIGAGIIALFLVFAILYTYSRGAFLALMVVLLLIAVERRIKFSLIVLVGTAAIILMQFLPVGFTDRLETLSIFTSSESSVYSEASFRGRSSEMLTGVNMFVDHPFLGVGVGNYPVYYQEYASRIGLERRSEDRQAHSLYLEIAAETGIIGLTVFAGLVISLLAGLGSARRRLKRLADHSHWASWITSLQMSIVAYLTTSIFLHSDYIRYFWLLAALTVALLHVTDHLEKQAHSQLAGEVKAA